jgi:hypothetical protein
MENRPAPHALLVVFPFLRNPGAQSILVLMAWVMTFLPGPLLMLARAGKAETAPGTTTRLGAPVDAAGRRASGNLLQGLKLRRQELMEWAKAA